MSLLDDKLIKDMDVIDDPDVIKEIKELITKHGYGAVNGGAQASQNLPTPLLNKFLWAVADHLIKNGHVDSLGRLKSQPFKSISMNPADAQTLYDEAVTAGHSQPGASLEDFAAGSSPPIVLDNLVPPGKMVFEVH